MLKNTKLENI